MSAAQDAVPAGVPGRERRQLGDTGRRIAVGILGLAAAVCLIAAELSTISSTHILTATCDDLAARELANGCDATGGDRHGYTLIVLALVAAAMAWGAGRRGRRPAAFALLGVGGIVAAIALIADLPTLGDTGTMGQLFSDVTTEVGAGFWLELAGAAAALLAGALGLVGRRATPAVAAVTSAWPVTAGGGQRGADSVATRAG
jgi:hypothetical protein